MNSVNINILTRYSILFFERFLQKLPQIPPSNLSQWITFRELLKKFPASIESIHHMLITMFECDMKTTLGQLETMNAPLQYSYNLNSVLATHNLSKSQPKVSFSLKPVVMAQSPPEKIGRSVSAHKLPNPFLDLQRKKQSEDNIKHKPYQNLNSGDDEEESSPMVRKYNRQEMSQSKRKSNYWQLMEENKVVLVSFSKLIIFSSQDIEWTLKNFNTICGVS